MNKEKITLKMVANFSGIKQKKNWKKIKKRIVGKKPNYNIVLVNEMIDFLGKDVWENAPIEKLQPRINVFMRDRLAKLNIEGNTPMENYLLRKNTFRALIGFMDTANKMTIENGDRVAFEGYGKKIRQYLEDNEREFYDE